MRAAFRQDQERAFAQEMARLNAAQRRAVERTEGPVVVLAGPGTGKTHLLAARIGNILLETDTGAHNILCLTFTEAGAKAMRERLLSFIGPEAHRVGIFTFHGFCSRVIQDNLQYFGRPGLEPLSELEKIRIIRGLLSGLGKEHPLRIGTHDEFQYERHLQHLFAAMKSENWAEDHLLQTIDAYVTGLPANPNFQYARKYKDAQKGDPKPGKIREESLGMERLRAAVELFPAYQQALKKMRRYDYGDMIGWVLRAFHDYPSLLRRYQERYQYLLVDEFQDTNGSQGEIVRLLSSYWENPNIFVVGDDDQAIYEFQGARLKSMQEFIERYADVTLVTLTENYRSNQPILDAATALIGGNAKRIGNLIPSLAGEKKLTAAGPPEPHGARVPAPLFLSCPTQKHETGLLLNQLNTWHEAGVAWKDMAVIYARHEQASELRYFLERAGIPYRSRKRPNVLDYATVRQLRELLTYCRLEAERPTGGEHLLYRLLHLDFFGAQPQDLARLNLARIREKDVGLSLREYLQEADKWPETLRKPEAIRAAGAFLETMIGAAITLPLADFVETVTNQSGLLANTLKREDRAAAIQYLGTFSDFLLGEIARRPELSLRQFLTTLEQMDNNRIELPLRSHLDQADAVELVTAHSAKGLEYDCVWLLDCSEANWGLDNKKGGSSRFRLPETLTYSGTEDEEEARRRLFFVALTRARREVVMCCAERDGRNRHQLRVRFVDELASAGLRTEARELAAAELTALTIRQLSATDQSRLPFIEQEAVTELLKEFRLSVSSLYAYLDCPLRFYFEKLLRVPDREREKALYGSSLHEALQDYFNRMRKDPGRLFPSKQELIFYFERALGKRRGLLTPEAYQQRLERGRWELDRYYDTYRKTWTDDVMVELYLGSATVDGIPLVGMIDRVDVVSDAFVRVVDYKTSATKTDKLKRPTAGKPHGGDFWRQLVFYKLLFDNSPGQIRRVKNGAISYLLINSEGQQPFKELEVQRKDTEALRKILAEVWEGIQEQNFAGCGKKDCEWCRFVEETGGEVPTGGTDVFLDDRT